MATYMPEVWKDSRGVEWVKIGRDTWQSNIETVIVGTPEENSDHDCDAMGCGYEHVLVRSQRRAKEAANG